MEKRTPDDPSSKELKKKIFNNSPYVNPLKEVPCFKSPSVPEISFKWKVKFKTKDKGFVSKRKVVKSQPLASSSFISDSPPALSIPDPQVSMIGRYDGSEKAKSMKSLIDELIAQKENELQLITEKKSSESIIKSDRPSPAKGDTLENSSADSFFSSLTFDETELITPPIKETENSTSHLATNFVRASDLISSESHPPLSVNSEAITGKPVGDDARILRSSKTLVGKNSGVKKSKDLQSPQRTYIKSELVSPRKSPKKSEVDASFDNLSSENQLLESVVIEPEQMTPQKNLSPAKPVEDASKSINPQEIQSPRLLGSELGTHQLCFSPKNPICDELIAPELQLLNSVGVELSTRKHQSLETPVGDESEMITSPKLLSQRLGSSELNTPQKQCSPEKLIGDNSALITSQELQSPNSVGNRSGSPRKRVSPKKPVFDDLKLVVPQEHSPRLLASEFGTPRKPINNEIELNSELLDTPRRRHSPIKSVCDDSRLIPLQDSPRITGVASGTPQKCGKPLDESKVIMPSAILSPRSGSELGTPRKNQSPEKPVGNESGQITPQGLKSPSLVSCEPITPQRRSSPKKTVGDESVLTTQDPLSSSGSESKLVTPRKSRSPNKLDAHNESQPSFCFPSIVSNISLSRKSYRRKNLIATEFPSPERSTPAGTELLHKYPKSKVTLMEGPTEQEVANCSKRAKPSVESMDQDEESFQNDEQNNQDGTFQSDDIPIIDNFSENDLTSVLEDNRLSASESEVSTTIITSGSTHNTGEVSPQNKRKCQHINEVLGTKVQSICHHTEDHKGAVSPSSRTTHETKVSSKNQRNLEKNSEVESEISSSVKLDNHYISSNEKSETDQPIDRSSESQVQSIISHLGDSVVDNPSGNELGKESPENERRKYQTPIQNKESEGDLAVDNVGDKHSKESPKKHKHRKAKSIDSLVDEHSEEFPITQENEEYQDDFRVDNPSEQSRELPKKKKLSRQKYIGNMESESTYYKPSDGCSEDSSKRKRQRHQNPMENPQNEDNSTVCNSIGDDCEEESPKKKRLKRTNFIKNKEVEVSIVDNPSGDQDCEKLPKRKKRRLQIPIENEESEANSINDNPSGEGLTEESPKNRQIRRNSIENKESEYNCTFHNSSGDEYTKKQLKKKKQKIEEHKSEGNSAVDNPLGDEYSNLSPKKKKRRPQNLEHIEDNGHFIVDNPSDLSEKSLKKQKHQKTIEKKENGDDSILDNPSGDKVGKKSHKNKKDRHEKSKKHKKVEDDSIGLSSEGEHTEESKKKHQETKKNRESEGNTSVDKLSGDENNQESPKKKKRRRQNLKHMESENSVVDSPLDKLSKKSTKEKHRKTKKIKECEDISFADNPSEDEHSEEPLKKRKQKAKKHDDCEGNSVVNDLSEVEYSKEPLKKQKQKHHKAKTLVDSNSFSCPPIVDNTSEDENEELPKKKKRKRQHLGHMESKDNSIVESSADAHNEELSNKKKRKTKKSKVHIKNENNSSDQQSDSPKKRRLLRSQNVLSKTVFEFISKNKKKKEKTSDTSETDDSDSEWLRSEVWLGKEHYNIGTDLYSIAVSFGGIEDADIYPQRWFHDKGYKDLNPDVVKEILDFLKLDKLLYEKIKNLDIKLDWKVNPVQLLSLKSKLDDEIKTFSQEKLRTGKFDTEEDMKIMKNWKTFCQKYDFHQNDFAPFLPFLSYQLSPLSKKQKVLFMLFLAQGLDRAPHKCYSRFTYLSKYKKSGKFSAKEDRLMKYLWYTLPQENFISLCGFFLHRSRDSIYLRSKSAIPEYGGYGIYYDKDVKFRQGEEAEKIKKDLIEKCLKYPRNKLKKKIPSVIAKVSKLNNCSALQVSKLFHLKVEPMLASKPIKRNELWAGIFEAINHLGYKTWTSVDWELVSEELGDLGPVFIYAEFRKLVRNFVPPRYRRLLSDVMLCLDENIHTIKSSSCDQQLKILPI